MLAEALAPRVQPVCNSPTQRSALPSPEARVSPEPPSQPPAQHPLATDSLPQGRTRGWGWGGGELPASELLPQRPCCVSRPQSPACTGPGQGAPGVPLPDEGPRWFQHTSPPGQAPPDPTPSTQDGSYPRPARSPEPAARLGLGPSSGYSLSAPRSTGRGAAGQRLPPPGRTGWRGWWRENPLAGSERRGWPGSPARAGRRVTASLLSPWQQAGPEAADTPRSAQSQMWTESLARRLGRPAASRGCGRPPGGHGPVAPRRWLAPPRAPSPGEPPSPRLARTTPPSSEAAAHRPIPADPAPRLLAGTHAWRAVVLREGS